MKCIDKICHNDQSFMLMHFICIIMAQFSQKIQKKKWKTFNITDNNKTNEQIYKNDKDNIYSNMT